MGINCLGVVMKSVKEGAQTNIYCSIEESSKLVDGGYYVDCKLAKATKLAEDE